MSDRTARWLRGTLAAWAAVLMVALVAVPCLRALPADDPAARYLLASWASVSIFVSIFGALLVALDGRPMTVGFGLFCLFSTGPVFVAQNDLAGLPAIAIAIATTATTILYDVGAIGFGIFALRFPVDAAPGRRGTVMRVVPYAIALFVALDVLNAVLWAHGRTDLWGDFCEYGLYLGVFAVSAVAIVRTYAGTSGDQRRRVLWVVVGAAVGYAALLVYNVGYFFNLPVLQYAAGICEIAIPLMVGYAILRHRVLDITIVVNRAAVFGVVMTVLICAIALVHWFVGKELEKTHLQLEFELLAAIILGLSLHRLHAFVEMLMERVFFRRGRTGRPDAFARTAGEVDRLMAALVRQTRAAPAGAGAQRAERLRGQIADLFREIVEPQE